MLAAPVVQKLDSAIHRINLYPVDNAIGFPNTYPLDSNLSGGKRYPTFEQLGPGRKWNVNKQHVTATLTEILISITLRYEFN